MKVEIKRSKRIFTVIFSKRPEGFAVTRIRVNFVSGAVIEFIFEL